MSWFHVLQKTWALLIIDLPVESYLFCFLLVSFTLRLIQLLLSFLPESFQINSLCWIHLPKYSAYLKVFRIQDGQRKPGWKSKTSESSGFRIGCLNNSVTGVFSADGIVESRVSCATSPKLSVCFMSSLKFFFNILLLHWKLFLSERTLIWILNFKLRKCLFKELSHKNVNGKFPHRNPGLRVSQFPTNNL